MSHRNITRAVSREFLGDGTPGTTSNENLRLLEALIPYSSTDTAMLKLPKSDKKRDPTSVPDRDAAAPFAIWPCGGYRLI